MEIINQLVPTQAACQRKHLKWVAERDSDLKIE
jgi:hypothetical protein